MSNNNNRNNNNNDNNNNNNNNRKRKLFVNNGNPYCKPVNKNQSVNGNNNNNNNNNNPQTRPIPLYVIPDLPNMDRCKELLQRVFKEYEPIIKERGYNVTTVSEMCCCSDGLDFAPRRRRKCSKQANNVWGYNQTRFWGRGKTSHAIHLRLRSPRDHHHSLLSYEDVAGTMAHELAHCVYQNHQPPFYKLMEELLEQHATLQAKLSSLMTFTPLNADFIQAQRGGTYNNDNSNNSLSMPTTGGYVLGGANANANGSAGKSRLLSGVGRRLGGGGMDGDSNNISINNINNININNSSLAIAAQRRELIARAAEQRQRILLQTRRRMEKMKGPCVFELLSDDDDYDNDNNDNNNDNTELAIREDSNKKPRAAISQPTTTSENNDAVPSNHTIPTMNKNNKVDIVDLTIDNDDNETANKNKHENTVVTVSPSIAWSCHRCTFQNQPMALACSICQSERQFI